MAKRRTDLGSISQRGMPGWGLYFMSLTRDDTNRLSVLERLVTQHLGLDSSRDMIRHVKDGRICLNLCPAEKEQEQRELLKGYGFSDLTAVPFEGHQAVFLWAQPADVKRFIEESEILIEKLRHGLREASKNAASEMHSVSVNGVRSENLAILVSIKAWCDRLPGASQQASLGPS